MMSLGRVQDLGICSFVKSLGLEEGAVPGGVQLHDVLGMGTMGYAAT
jgi:hypothetical protein